jgi:hypothetical protein
MEGLAINALLVQLYQPELLSGGLTGAAVIGTPCCMARSVRTGECSGFSRCMWGSRLPMRADRSLRWERFWPWIA